MDYTRVFITLGGLLLILFVLWFFFGKEDGEGDLATASDHAPIYQCPMHPWIKSLDAGANCSICEMKLVLSEDEIADEPAPA